MSHKHYPPAPIEGQLDEPWVVLADGSDLKDWGRDQEIAYNQTNRQSEKALFFRRTFDFLTDNRVHGDYHEYGCHRCRTFRMALTEARKHNLENMQFHAQQYSKALGRTITYQDIPLKPWRDGLIERGLAVHLVNHLATMADLHRAGRYDRMSDDVFTLTGQGPLGVEEFVRKNAATFTAPAKVA